MKKRQPSSIDLRLPEDIREKLRELLRDPRVTQLEATRRINQILDERGLPERIYKSSVNRYSLRMEEVGAKLRQSREVAKMWIGRLGAEPQGEVGKLLNEIVRTLAFESTMKMAERKTPVPPRMLKDLSIAVERLERAATTNIRRDEEIRSQALKDAADVVEETAKQQGLNKEQARFWREQVLGVK